MRTSAIIHNPKIPEKNPKPTLFSPRLSETEKWPLSKGNKILEKKDEFSFVEPGANLCGNLWVILRFTNDQLSCPNTEAATPRMLFIKIGGPSLPTNEFNFQIFKYTGISKDKTMNEKLMYIPNDYTQNYPLWRLKLVVKTFGHSIK